MSIKDTDYSQFLVELRAELDGGHPVTGAYDADDQIAADQINEANRTITYARPRADLRDALIASGQGVWSRLIDDARAVEEASTTQSTQGVEDSRTLLTYTRVFPATADFVNTFETALATVALPTNLRADPYDGLLETMSTTEATLGGGAAAATRALCDLITSRANELWGSVDVPATTVATVREFRENVLVVGVDIERARAL